MPDVDSTSISVALCTHNGSAFLREQLLSILRQSVPVSEIVLSDDASTDATVALFHDTLNVWAAKGSTAATAGGNAPRVLPRVTVLQNETALGVTANFAQALAACTGEIIVLSDQDDVWHEQKVAKILAAFDAEPNSDLAFSDARMVDGAGVSLNVRLFETLGLSARERTLIAQHNAFDALLRRNIVTGATAAVRSRLVQRSQPFPASWVHDEWLSIVASAQSDLTMIDEPLIDYRQHGGNQIGASQLTAGGALGRLKAPRTARNRRLLVRAQDLAERMPQLTPRPSDERIRLAQLKLGHERRRSSYPAARLRRIVPVWRAWRAGGYDQFGLGLQDIVRDLVQPV